MFLDDTWGNMLLDDTWGDVFLDDTWGIVFLQNDTMVESCDYTRLDKVYTYSKNHKKTLEISGTQKEILEKMETVNNLYTKMLYSYVKPRSSMTYTRIILFYLHYIFVFLTMSRLMSSSVFTEYMLDLMFFF